MTLRTDQVSSSSRAGLVLRGRLPLGWFIAHAVSLFAILGVLVVAGRGQWFFFDEWDFLAERAEWDLFVPHNGHLSFFPQLLTTLVKSVAGLHSYWPYLLLTFAAHLFVVHMLWRLMMRMGVAPVLALVVPVVLGVLAPGTENTLWAFQVGFITPLGTGIAAVLLALRDPLRSRDVVGITLLLLIGVGFASTGLPMVLAVLLLVVCRHGWRAAIVPAGVLAVCYGTWYLLFARGTTGKDGFGARSLSDVLLRVPEFAAHGLVDSLGKAIPLPALASAILIALCIGVLLDLRRHGLRAGSGAYALVFAGLVFAALTAFTRVGLGVENASAGRYVYVYAALAVPLIGRLLTALIGRSRAAGALVVTVLLALIAYNAAGTVVMGRNDASMERTVERTMSAALTIDDGSSDIASRTPAAMVAPTLTMADIRSFVARGQFTPVPFTAEDLLSAKTNLLLTPFAVDSAVSTANCRAGAEGWIDIDPAADTVSVSAAGVVGVIANEGDVQGFGTRIPFASAGTYRLDTFSPDVRIRLDANGVTCVSADGLAETRR